MSDQTECEVMVFVYPENDNPGVHKPTRKFRHKTARTVDGVVKALKDACFDEAPSPTGEFRD